MPKGALFTHNFNVHNSLPLNEYNNRLTAPVNIAKCSDLFLLKLIFKPGMCGHRPCVPGFLKLLWLVRQYVCVCVPTLRPLITSHMKGTRNNWIMKFYGYIVSLYDTAIDKLNRCGLSNTAGHEHLPKQSQVNAVLATEGLPCSTNKSECFNYKGEWANA